MALDGKTEYDAFLKRGYWENSDQRDAGLSYQGSQGGNSLYGTTAHNEQGINVGDYGSSGDITPAPSIEAQTQQRAVDAAAGHPVIGGGIPSAPQTAPAPATQQPAPTAQAPKATQTAQQTTIQQPGMLQGATAKAGAVFTDPGSGNKFTITGINPDGSINWVRDDGQAFNNIDRATFQRYFPSGAEQYYGALSGGSSTDGTGAYYTNVSPNDTVEGRLQGLLARGNPLLEMAITKAQQNMNARGLLNSSIANEAGQAAVIQNALPIAQQDAATFAQTRLANQQYANQGVQQLRDIAAKEQILAQQGQIDLQKIAAQGSIELQGIELRAQTDLAMKEVEAQFQREIRASASGAQIYQQLQSNIAAIQTNPNLDAASKARLIQDQITIARGGLQIAGSLSGNINLVEQLDSILTAPVSGDSDRAPPADGGAGGPGTVDSGSQQIINTESQS